MRNLKCKLQDLFLQIFQIVSESFPETVEPNGTWRKSFALRYLNKIKMSEIRVLLTKWLGESWTKFCDEKQDYITERFKSVGFFNDIHGRENHLVKVPKVKDYSPPKKDDPRAELRKTERVNVSDTEDESFESDEEADMTTSEEESDEEMES